MAERNELLHQFLQLVSPRCPSSCVTVWRAVQYVVKCCLSACRLLHSWVSLLIVCYRPACNGILCRE